MHSLMRGRTKLHLRLFQVISLSTSEGQEILDYVLLHMSDIFVTIWKCASPVHLWHDAEMFLLVTPRGSRAVCK
jgi:hypothetical protein